MTCEPWTPDTEVQIQIRWRMYCPDHRREVSNLLEEEIAGTIQRFMKMHEIDVGKQDDCGEFSMTTNVFGPSYDPPKPFNHVYHYHARKFK